MATDVIQVSLRVDWRRLRIAKTMLRHLVEIHHPGAEDHALWDLLSLVDQIQLKGLSEGTSEDKVYGPEKKRTTTTTEPDPLEQELRRIRRDVGDNNGQTHVSGNT